MSAQDGVEKDGVEKDGAEQGVVDGGSGTVLMTGLALALLILLGLTVLFVQASVGAARAAAAADLAALAAADAARGLADGEPCAVAAEVAEYHHVTLEHCSRDGSQGHIVEVTVSISWSPALGPATARARAGPPP